MKENKYDDPQFFQKYSEMTRSRQGLAGAGEWPELEKLLPDFQGLSVLDLGCGYGWHCFPVDRYYLEGERTATFLENRSRSTIGR